jgi:hypothetical protein
MQAAEGIVRRLLRGGEGTEQGKGVGRCYPSWTDGSNTAKEATMTIPKSEEVSFESLPVEVQEYLRKELYVPAIRCLQNDTTHHIVVTLRSRRGEDSLTFLQCSDGWLPPLGGNEEVQ